MSVSGAIRCVVYVYLAGQKKRVVGYFSGLILLVAARINCTNAYCVQIYVKYKKNTALWVCRVSVYYRCARPERIHALCGGCVAVFMFVSSHPTGRQEYESLQCEMHFKASSQRVDVVVEYVVRLHFGN